MQNSEIENLSKTGINIGINMHISQINNTNFSSKPKTLTAEQLKNFENIKEKIGTSSFIFSDNNFYMSTVAYLNTDNVYLMNINPTEVLLGKSKMTISNDGTVSILKKPLLKSKSRLIELLGEYLATFSNFYYNNDIVKKECILSSGYIDKNTKKAIITERKWIKYG